jgi:hypothetical protein
MVSDASVSYSVGKRQPVQDANRELKKPATIPGRTLRTLLRLSPRPSSILGDGKKVQRLGVSAVPHVS